MLVGAYKKEIEEKLWQQWKVEFSRMDESNFIPWDKYKEDMLKPHAAPVNAKQAIMEAEKIKNADQQKYKQSLLKK